MVEGHLLLSGSKKNQELSLSIRRESGLKNGVAKNVDDHHRFSRLKNKAK